MMKSVPDEAILIGDSPRRDIEPGHYLGILYVFMPGTETVSLMTVHRFGDFVIDAIADLPEILYRL